MSIDQQMGARLGSLGIDRLTSFLGVIDHGGFSAAAEALPRSQSRVSVHVAELEDRLGAPLIDRASRPVVPTDIGLVLAQYVRRALNELRVGADHVQALLNLEEGEVRLGSYGSASIAFLPAVLRNFSDKHPRVHVMLYESDAQQIERALAERRVSLAVRTLYPPPRTEGIRWRPLWRERIVLVMPDGRDVPDVLDVAQAREILRTEKVISVGLPPDSSQNDGMRDLDTVRLLGLLGADPARAIYTLHPQALISMVRAGLGVGIVNSLAVDASDSTGVIAVPLDCPDARRDVVVCWYEGHYHSIAERRMFDEIVNAPAPPGTERLESVDHATPRSAPRRWEA